MPPGLSIRQVLEAALAAAHVNEAEREGRLREAELAAPVSPTSMPRRPRSQRRLAQAAGHHRGAGLEPEVMLLDEPTNHLDLAGIEWLEELLASSSFAAVTVSHDRYFLESTSSEIIELNRVFADGLLRVKGNFSRFLEEKQAYLGIAEPPAGEPAQPGEDRDRVAAARPQGADNEIQGAH